MLPSAVAILRAEVRTVRLIARFSPAILPNTPLAALLLPALALSGCFKTDLAELPDSAVAFEPEAEGAPADWSVQAIDMDITCPDGEKTRFYLVYPDEAANSGSAVPAAVVYHSGSFDFVYAPTTDEPLEGTHFATPNRLNHGWAIREIFVTLGMLPDEIADTTHTGVLPVALANEGVAMLFPSNCWGDWWHNRSAIEGNDFDADYFNREGRTTAEWGYQLLADPNFAAAFQIEMPIVVDTNEVYAIGLGEGGRAVTELLSIDNDEDGVTDYTPAGALVDSTADDLSIFFADPALFGNAVAGLSRIFPDADTSQGSLASAAIPERFGYLYALQDPEIPRASHLQAMDLLLSDTSKWVYVTDSTQHVLLNGDDAGLAADAVSYLRTGVVPPSGDGAPVQ